MLLFDVYIYVYIYKSKCLQRSEIHSNCELIVFMCMVIKLCFSVLFFFSHVVVYGMFAIFDSVHSPKQNW